MGEDTPFAEGHVVAGRWRSTRLLGAGSFGWVVAAQRVGDETTTAALKILRPDVPEAGTSIARFVRRELEILKRVHAATPVPQVVRAIEPEILSDRGHHVMVLELVDGPSLGEVIAAERVMDQAEARAILVDLATGLGAIHAAGGVHRDLKPDNVRIRADGCAVVLDLGIAKALWSTEQLTRSAAAPMTPLYASPEQLAGEEVGPPADVFALGLIGYEMLVGTVPLSGRTLPEIIRARAEGTAPDVSSFGRPVSQDLATTIHRCLARSPRRRPTADDVVRALRDAIADTHPAAPARSALEAATTVAVSPAAGNSRAPVAYERTEPAPTVDEPRPASPRAPRWRVIVGGGVVAAAAVSALVIVNVTSRSGEATTPSSASAERAPSASAASASADPAPSATGLTSAEPHVASLPAGSSPPASSLTPTAPSAPKAGSKPPRDPDLEREDEPRGTP